MIRVLIADDQHLVRTGFGLILDAADGAEAVRRTRELVPDVVLMDIRMPNVDGIAATRQLLALADPPRVLILTTFDLDEYVYPALAAGASGFILKDVKAGVLADAVRTVYAGDSLLAPSVTRRLITDYIARAPSRVPVELPQLTDREREVLVLIAHGQSNREIAATLVVAETTVKTHVSRIFAKLGARDRVHAVIAAYESGLLTTTRP
jgi:DNA-binding NarL/FixJ family response regulator